MLCPERNKFSDSKLKAENVVKPPRKPTTTKSLAFSEISPEIIKRPASKPIMKHPITLTVNVPSGKELELAIPPYLAIQLSDLQIAFFPRKFK